MSTTPHPASVVMVAYPASATATRMVQAVATVAAARTPNAAIAEPTTNSGISRAATSTGSRVPRVVSCTNGIVKTAIHQAAPATA